jgi:hypothetical protein
MKRMKHWIGYALALCLGFCLVLGTASAAMAGSVTLKKAFIEKYKNRATIDASFIVDHAHPRPNPPVKDGDMHVAGRAQKEVGLPMVAEVMNAAQKAQGTAVNDIHADENGKTVVPISGAWRFWFEHPSATPQIQFAAVPPAKNTNPDHCFEIHPITKFAGEAVLDSFQFVPGFDAHPAKASFDSYEKLTISLKVSASAVTMVSPKAGFNYADFFIEFVGSPQKLDDGGVVALANVLEEAKGDPIVENVRMIFVPGTPPADQMESNPPAEGDVWHVLGIPRVSLEAVSAWISKGGGNISNRKLPYEMIIVGVE